MREPGSPIWALRRQVCAPKMTGPIPANNAPTGDLAPSAVDEPLAPLAAPGLGTPRETPSFRAPRVGALKVVLISLFMLGALGFMAANVLHPGRAQRLRKLGASEARLESMMLSLEHDNDRLMSELHRLERGAQGWQALARKEYGMLLEGEYVYRFPPSAN